MMYQLWIRDFRDGAIVKGPFKSSPEDVEQDSLQLLDNIHPDHYLDCKPRREGNECYDHRKG